MSDSITAFADLGLSEPVQKALRRIGYEQPSPIQAESIPILLNGRDLLGVAQTGTGKTAAFALPILAKLNLAVKSPQVLVLTPTRELAIQVAEAFQNYASEMSGFRVLPIYGGQDFGTQLRNLKRGVHVIVGTPGRTMDHLRRKTLKLNNMSTVVLDEADEMLRMGFIDDVTEILSYTPDTRQVALFSATMPDPIKRIADSYMTNPAHVKVVSKGNSVEKIEQCYWMVSGVNKLDALTRILEVEEFDGILIFVRTKTQTVELAEKLQARGHQCAAINGDMTQNLRERTIDHLKRNKVDIVVATDVAARGIDVTRITHVINYDIPYDVEAYIHRIGRTGRAGREGKAILFVAPRERRLLGAIERATKQKIKPIKLPTHEQANQKRIEQFKGSLAECYNNDELDFYLKLLTEMVESDDMDPLKLAAAMASMHHKDRPFNLLASNHKSGAKPARENDQYRDRDSRDRDRGRDRDRDRGSRDDRAPRRADRNDEVPSHHKAPTKRLNGILMGDFRIDVGNKHNATASLIVEVITTESGIDSKHIGQISVFDDYSSVELPDDMPSDIFKHLKKSTVKGQPLRLQRLHKAAKPKRSKPSTASKGRGKPSGKPAPRRPRR